MRRACTRLLLPWSGVLLLLLAQTAAAGPALRMDRERVNIRADATSQSALVAVLSAGEEVEELGRRNEWRRIRMKDGREGWINGSLVQELLVVVGTQVRIRAAGSTAAPVVAAAAGGDVLGQLDRQGKWVKVSLPEGGEGWIWADLVQPKSIEIPALAGTAVGAGGRGTASARGVSPEGEPPAPEVQPEREGDARAAMGEPVPSPGAVRASPFVEGLQCELEGNFQRALECFEQVLTQEPNHLKALSHAAEAHKRLGDYSLAREKLLRLLELGERPREVYADLSEVYRLGGSPDSASKYLALSHGEEWGPGEEMAEEEPPEPSTAVRPLVDMLWIYAAVVGGVAVLVVVLILLLRRQKASPAGTEKKGKFIQTMRQTGDDLRVGEGEVEELDRQIQTKKDELRESSAAFLGTEKGALSQEGAEDRHLEQVLGQLEALRRALEMQDERTQIYADIVRLQNMKIQAMSQQLQLLRRRRKA